jgi:hypothetical protein
MNHATFQCRGQRADSGTGGDDAREFYVRAEAEPEIESFAALLPDGFRFEIEEVWGHRSFTRKKKNTPLRSA